METEIGSVVAGVCERGEGTKCKGALVNLLERIKYSVPYL